MIPFDYIEGSFIDQQTDFGELVEVLGSAFGQSTVIAPTRHHHEVENPQHQDSTLLLMPAWKGGESIGVKVVTVSPENGKYNQPSIQGSYLFMDGKTGVLKAVIDAPALTAKRTAAASALASKFLSRTESSSLLMIGTGALSPNLIRAHIAVRPIKDVYVYGRSFHKAAAIADSLRDLSITINPVSEIADFISDVDIVSCATLSAKPLVLGKLLRPGQHLDLVGSYKPDMREADDDVILKSEIYVDTKEGAMKESGDICIPLNEGLISEKDIRADLFDLCSNAHKVERSPQAITMFKSVGHALEDLAAAEYYFNKFKLKSTS